MPCFVEKPCTWNGIQYPSVLQAARANYISPPAMHYRLSQDYTSDSEMECYGSVGIACEWNGVWYGSLAAAARANGVTPPAMKARIIKGYTCDEDVKR